MKRQKLVSYETASPGTQAIYDEAKRTLQIDYVPNWMQALGNNENILRATWEKFKYVVLEGEVPQLLKQLILFMISIKANNEYCTAVHGYSALNLDPTLTYDDLMSMARGESYGNLPVTFQVALDLVTQAALSSKDVADEDFDFEEQLLDEGFSEQEIDELMAQADFGMMMNVIIDIYDIPVDVPFGPDVS